MSDHTPQQTTLVLGGTGKTGRRVMDRLAARGVPARLGSRAARIVFVYELTGPRRLTFVEAGAWSDR